MYTSSNQGKPTDAIGKSMLRWNFKSTDEIREAISNSEVEELQLRTKSLAANLRPQLIGWLCSLSLLADPDHHPVHKMGAFDDCDNFRGIALLSASGKVICHVIHYRLRE